MTKANRLQAGNKKKTKKIKGKEKKKRPPKPPPLITPTLYYNNLPIVNLSLYVSIVRQGKWDNQFCFACGETLLDEKMWNDIPECGGTCDVLYQYIILISDWVRKETPIKAAWRRAVHCPHDDDKIWRMALAKIKGVMPEEIKMIKDNPPEPLELDWDAEPIINLLDLEQFHEHYQKLAPTREKQEQ
ncbi:hypothetical protein G9A89_012471 [Geosiphon pyriformis]|nr:hypothetical protein G9A89_012471 [Geosiphon pyriformis]